jgi:hypothetical protein
MQGEIRVGAIKQLHAKCPYVLGWYLGNTITNKTLPKMETDSVVSGAEQSDLITSTLFLIKTLNNVAKAAKSWIISLISPGTKYDYKYSITLCLIIDYMYLHHKKWSRCHSSLLEQYNKLNHSKLILEHMISW